MRMLILTAAAAMTALCFLPIGGAQAMAPGSASGVRAALAQTDLIESVRCYRTPSGRLVYSVCSLEREEGEDQVRAFLASHPDFALDPIAPGEGGAPLQSQAAEGWLRILPHHLPGGLDGFFIARFRRKAGSG